MAAHRAGLLTDAASGYREILQHWPQHPDALHLLGLITQQGGNHAEAIVLFAQAAKANPQAAPPQLQRGFSLLALGQNLAAAAAFKAAITRQPKLAEAHHQLGNTLRTLKRLPEALPNLRDATRLAPADAVIWLSRGLACMESQLLDEAVESFQQAVKLNGSLPEARAILGQCLMAQHKYDEAWLQLEAALQLRPNYAEALHDMGRLCMELGLLSQAASHYRAALAAKSTPETRTNLFLLLNYLPETSPEQHFAEHRQWSVCFEQPLRPAWRPHANNPSPARRLRVGYVSPDFRAHPVTSFIEPILQAHQRENVEVFCYANVAKPDATTRRLQLLADHWRDIHGFDPDKAAELIRQDGIDILVDLAGHTTHNSLLVFARKPAPVQVTWIGYPNTTGLDAIDYRLTDFITDPPGQTEAWHSEQLFRLPKTFSCYGPAADSPAVGPLPALANGFVTFGSFNNFRKLSGPTIELWARILREQPSARLLLKSQGLGEPKTVRRLHEQFARAGVPAARIELAGSWISTNQHMEMYNRVDLCLDPFPYNGTTTTCDALWMGLPVVTLIGRTHVARVGVSLVTHLGFPEWAVATPDTYAAKCRKLTGDLPALASLRARLREQMRTSPLCDVGQFIGPLEAAYRAMWQRWCGQPPAG